MPFFVVPIGYVEQASGVLSPVAETPSAAYDTRDAAHAAASAVNPVRSRRREAWSNVYGQPFPGEDQRVVEAPDGMQAQLFLSQELSGVRRQGSIDPLPPWQGGTARLIRITVDERVINAMPNDVRVAYDRCHTVPDVLTLTQEPGEASSLDEFEAYYREQRNQKRRFWEYQNDLQKYARWIVNYRLST